MEWRRITIADTPEYNHLTTVQVFFNAIGDGSFVKTIDNLTKGIGIGYNGVHCRFPADMDEYEREVERGGVPLEGIEFAFDWGEEVVVDVETFRRYLTMACAAYVRDHPEDAAKIAELLARPQPPLDVPTAVAA